MKYPINNEGVELLRDSEQFVGVAYPDPVSPMGRALQRAGLWRSALAGEPIPAKFANLDPRPWTLGWGFTDGVHPGDTMTEPEANAKLARMLVGYVTAVREACTVEPNENELAGLVVCAWNIGKEAIATSSMVKAHNRGDKAAAARAFALWNKSRGVVVQALVKRRAAEAALYLKPVGGRVDAPGGDEFMPQTVQGESSLLRSPIIQGITATATTGITALAHLADQAQDAISTLSPLLRYWPYIAIAAIVIVASAVVWHRWNQRRQGWA